ncbi:uncharacterized protein PHACADRAFT_252828 [Phanerochaete carnosa HHB-10118-sp]|uniref:Steroid 5-alpha reductase C-terminal domain-containing protein n=1 Tax=Phanerochaete carnosa (strain HHB-10118-sp) TaxID=650164 RepID=K5WH95_PHACS|nr:uncharacterized protein PHACADRAFT_252828 [Phanerochaete carnosa HHB-10118-sp]EKM58479.1 hypothetical protein PHACADRAFT_252828 [Phanerochaete carnosa HHB-10118-sp]
MPPAVVQYAIQGMPPSLQWPVKTCIYTTATCYVLSIITGNVSQVDRIWTFMPTIYTAYFALLPLWPRESPLPLFPFTPKGVHLSIATHWNPRTLLMFALQFVWMCRLSYNTWRRGLFSLHEEDYRWAILRRKVPSWLFQVVNLTFIAIIQNIILFVLAIPTYIAVFQEPTCLSTSDYVLGALSLTDLALEFVADNQQYSFQTYKHTGVVETNPWPGANIKWTPAEVKRGFVTRGLWAWSRHPNFLCEQSFWVLMTLFPILAPESPAFEARGSTPWTSLLPLTPALVLCMLFFSSTLFTESISYTKYPKAYGAYQQRVAMFVPFLTPVWGFFLQLQGKKADVDALLFGHDVKLVEEKTKID